MIRTHPPTSDVPLPCAEVLIERARRRHRRRQISIAIVLAAVVAIGAVVYGFGFAGGTPTTNEATVKPPPPLTVDATAFRQIGSLAFDFKGALYVLDGATGSLRRIVVRGLTPARPQFSEDGQWLAFTAAESPFGYVGSSPQSPQLWIARGDGTDPHEVEGLRNPQVVGWSPLSDQLAVMTSTTDPLNPAATFENALRLVNPDGTSRVLYAVTSTKKSPNLIYDAAWSPTGRQIALATTDFFPDGHSVLLTVDVDNGARTTWMSIPIRRTFHGRTGTVIDPAAWWSQWGIGFWVYQAGMTRNNDGTPLYVIASPRSSPKELGTTLSDGVTDAIAASADGQLAIVSTGFRDIGLGGTKVETCSVSTRSCHPVPGASTWSAHASFTCPKEPETYCFKPAVPGSRNSGVTVDPSWSPDGTKLAYARGPAAPQSLTSTRQLLAYRALFIYDTKTRTTRRIGNVRGVSVPQWSRNGRYILYTADDSIWLLRLRDDRALRIAGPLFTGHVTGTYQDIYPNYYHQVPWSQEFSWWSQ